MWFIFIHFFKFSISRCFLYITAQFLLIPTGSRNFMQGKIPWEFVQHGWWEELLRQKKSQAFFHKKKNLWFFNELQKTKIQLLTREALVTECWKIEWNFFTITTKFCSFLMVYASNASILISRNSTIHFFQPAVNEIWKLCDYTTRAFYIGSIFQNQFLGRSSQIHEKSKKT